MMKYPMTIMVAVMAAVTAGSAHAADVPPAAAPPGDISTGLGAILQTALAPLDAATRPVNDVMRPLTGSETFASGSSSAASSAVPAVRRGPSSVSPDAPNSIQPPSISH